MRAFAILISTLACLVSTAAAQVEPRVFSTCAEARRMRVARGAVIRVECDSAFVYNRAAELVLRQKGSVADSIDSLTDSLLRTKDTVAARLRALASLRDSIRLQQRAVIDEMQRIHAIEQIAYDSLRVFFRMTDSLSRESVRNTDRALSYITRLKWASRFSSAVVGGVGGGFAIHASGDEGFTWYGAVGGAIAGLVVNGLVMRIVR